MRWLQMIVRSLLGHTRYHEQANEVNNRRLRTDLLSKQLEVVRRGK